MTVVTFGAIAATRSWRERFEQHRRNTINSANQELEDAGL